jgi:pyridoxamine 5'-phosphate oxidase
VQQLSAQESDAYFATRPRGHQLGAAASPQSQVVPDRAALDRAMRDVAERYPEGTPVPRPAYWGGYVLAPETVEFWEGREDRLHDRLRYRAIDQGWVLDRLAP